MADIYNGTSNTLISGTSGNDTIASRGKYSTINAGVGNDSIENDANFVTIAMFCSVTVPATATMLFMVSKKIRRLAFRATHIPRLKAVMM